MRKILTVATTEFINAVRSKAFIISVLLVPALFGASIGVQVLMGKRTEEGDRKFAVIDHKIDYFPLSQMKIGSRLERAAHLSAVSHPIGLRPW